MVAHANFCIHTQTVNLHPFARFNGFFTFGLDAALLLQLTFGFRNQHAHLGDFGVPPVSRHDLIERLEVIRIHPLDILDAHAPESVLDAHVRAHVFPCHQFADVGVFMRTRHGGPFVVRHDVNRILPVVDGVSGGGIKRAVPQRAVSHDRYVLLFG